MVVNFRVIRFQIAGFAQCRQALFDQTLVELGPSQGVQYQAIARVVLHGFFGDFGGLRVFEANQHICQAVEKFWAIGCNRQ